MSNAPKYTFDENLREIPESIEEMQSFVSELLKKSREMIEVEQQVQLLGNAGVFLRILNRLDESENALLQANALIESNHLSRKVWAVQSIRFSHLLQWKGKFNESEALLFKVLEECQLHIELSEYLDFVWQHLGKNYFDQKKYGQAIECFNKALELRIKKNKAELIESTMIGIRQAKLKMGSS